uniref:Malate dehydrogenase n=1 Tax=Oxyrrhis marina TaxID=2969 RepID=A0A7S3UGL2_OXYMA
MLGLAARRTGIRAFAQQRGFASGFKVCVCGGAGGIGQPLSLLMAMDSKVTELSVQDIQGAMVPAAGVASDLSHLEYPSKVTGYAIDPKLPPVDQLEAALTGCSLVLVPAGVPRKPGMTRDDLFNINASIAAGIGAACAKYCPDAILALIVNPVNSVVPAVAELYKKQGLDSKKVVGVTTLDVVRANKFVSEISGVPVSDVDVTVIGGHAGKTILPVLSGTPVANLPEAELHALDARIQDAGTEVVNAKAGAGSATLSMAYAGARFGKSVLRGLSGEKTVECAYVESNLTPLPFFTSKVVLGKNGVEELVPLPTLTAYEQQRFDEASAQLGEEIEKGLAFARK